MDLSAIAKKATSLAKNNEYKKAVKILTKAFRKIGKKEGVDKAYLAKVIPYFQKAGMYNEVENYVLNEAKSYAEAESKSLFSHKVAEVQESMFNLIMALLYEKLELCAKREKKEDDRKRFSEIKEQYKQRREILNNLGEIKECKISIKKYEKMFGKDTTKWSDTFKDVFRVLEKYEKERIELEKKYGSLNV